MRSVAVHALQSIQKVASQTEQSWLERLTADPEMEANQPNHSPRQVTSGHYVEVLPTPLPSPELVIYSPEVAEMLEIPPEEIESEAFKAFFSGDQSQVPNLKSWCTPYALAIMGQRMVSNCPFGNGNGYGDGRAISVGELLTASGRYEMQLKGAGRTPFCRGGDGRAVLRSSVREFLASEAMHHLGVETTRALCLIVSHGETARRAWYSGAPAGGMFGGSREPDTVIDEPCAISTRVSPSFLRVGHVDLFARRAAGSSESMAELEQIVEHALFREYPQIAERQEPLKEKAILMLEEFPERLGQMVAGWLRCGFCQGNFNSDNCLVGGRTMDYGPFGWIDRYNPLFAKWTGSGEHYGFLNQPQAAIANFHTLLTSVAVLLGDEAQPKVVALMEAGARKIRAAAQDAFRAKLGFEAEEAETALELWKDLEPLMRKSDIDYTIFWRQLAAVLECAESDQLQQIEPAFYKAPSKELAEEWQAWLQRWADTVGDAQEVTARLRAVNPKYVPREWMLAEAYDKAAQGDYSLVSELLELFRHPYDEQPAFEAKYFSRGPEEKVNQGGIAYMT
ncbi:Protein adenylyltransferase SelO [Durusdinium trenchii]